MRRHLPTLTLVTTLTLVSTLFLACSSDEPAAPPAPPPDAPTASPPQAAPPAAPPPAADAGLAPVTSRSGAGEGAVIAAPGALFTLPAAWIPETPSSGMRLAQARIPGGDGDGELTVFYFGPGGGGGVDANLQRWIGQVELDPGTEPVRETFDSGGFRITWVDAEGTLKPSTMGTGPTTPQPGSRLLAAVVEGPQGPWFFKATGPAKTLADARLAFLEMLKSATVHG